jgi:hypothetical protein
MNKNHVELYRSFVLGMSPGHEALATTHNQNANSMQCHQGLHTTLLCAAVTDAANKQETTTMPSQKKTPAKNKRVTQAPTTKKENQT